MGAVDEGSETWERQVDSHKPQFHLKPGEGGTCVTTPSLWGVLIFTPDLWGVLIFTPGLWGVLIFTPGLWGVLILRAVTWDKHIQFCYLILLFLIFQHQETLLRPVLSFYHVGPRDVTRICNFIYRKEIRNASNHPTLDILKTLVFKLCLIPEPG